MGDYELEGIGEVFQLLFVFACVGLASLVVLLSLLVWFLSIHVRWVQ